MTLNTYSQLELTVVLNVGIHNESVVSLTGSQSEPGCQCTLEKLRDVVFLLGYYGHIKVPPIIALVFTRQTKKFVWVFTRQNSFRGGGQLPVHHTNS